MSLRTLKSFALAAALICGAVTSGHADGQFWVAGNRAKSSCDIVTSNPVITPIDGYSFASGPYRSLDDAKLARTTIGSCPKVDDPPVSAPPSETVPPSE